MTPATPSPTNLEEFAAPGAAVETRDEAFAREIRERDELRAAQTAKAAQVRLAQLCRTNPEVRVLVEENAALLVSIDQLREKHEQEKGKLIDELNAEIARTIAAEQAAHASAAELEGVKRELAGAVQELRAAQAELTQARAEVEASKVAVAPVPAAEPAPSSSKKKADKTS